MRCAIRMTVCLTLSLLQRSPNTKHSHRQCVIACCLSVRAISPGELLLNGVQERRRPLPLRQQQRPWRAPPHGAPAPVTMYAALPAGHKIHLQLPHSV